MLICITINYKVTFIYADIYTYIVDCGYVDDKGKIPSINLQ